MFFSCGVNSSSPGRQLVVSESVSEDLLRDPPSQALRTLSPVSASTATSSSSTSRSCSPCVRSEQIVPGKWTHISGKVSVRPLTPSEAETVLAKQRKRDRKSRRSKKGSLHVLCGSSTL